MGHRTDQEDSLQYRQRLGAGPLLFRIRGVEEDREGDWAAVKSVAQMSGNRLVIVLCWPSSCLINVYNLVFQWQWCGSLAE